MTITEWPMAERPREKLLCAGAATLSDAELLAIFLRSGTRGSTAVDLGRKLLVKFGSLSALLSAGQAVLLAEPGLGPGKYAQLMASRELVQRVLMDTLVSQDVLDHPERVKNYLRLLLGSRDIEIFVVIFLSVRNHVLSVHEIFHGTLTETHVYPREILRLALLCNASAVIVAHNHPSGDAEPSLADLNLTEALQKALRMVDIRLLDHLVITAQGAVSLAEQGWL